jgi:hypothetical protein
VWEQELVHRLFNFSEGYRELPEIKQLTGSCKKQQRVTYLIDIVSRLGLGDISCVKPSEYNEVQLKKSQKLLNVIYNNGDYYLYKPGNPDKRSHINQIDNFLWQIIKFSDSKTARMAEGDIVRFGRIPFKVSRICLSTS